MFDLTGKVALITGANGGIPRATAALLRSLGAHLVLTDLDRGALDGFAASLPEAQTRIVTAQVDVTQRDQVDEAVALAGREFGGIDILVTGAGLYVEQEVAAMSDDDWRRTIGVNLDGVFYTTRAAMPLLRRGGSVVNIASMAGHRGSVRHAHYAACKAAVLGFTRSLVHELSPRGVRANCVSPGIIATAMTEAVMRDNGAALLAATPMKRFGTPEEVASVIAFLASDAAGFVNGETIHINGGIYMD
ncbi:SDR family NAD(P)-dependent oxidoreductase [Roseomonas sp. CECT 9278]|uniref:SDR family NAD(P)-dependent oxidoreductase n=1 Tax=Roseomonas sp. CECT 9278 TaxID=2845823 RepID=UPI001E60B27E|nr:SDR family NAD(P)-dependent oxidoreductase [Roseomonas sp. CECT 9278]CAH0212073.1 3-oxoacyl-[acyl-carrier-protein] reductase FabG [Roseomonas sp. CECT 9278]